MTDILEYPQYTNDQEQYWETLSEDQVLPMIEKKAFTTGLSSFFNWQNYLIPFFNEDSIKLQPYTTAWSLSETEMGSFIDNVRNMVE